MTKLTSRQINSLKRALDKIERTGRRSDYDLAKWAQRVSDQFGLRAYRVMVDQVGVYPSRARAYLRRLECLQVIPDLDVWIAVGWSRVSQIARLDEGVRSDVVAEILAHRSPSGITSGARVAAILEPYKRTQASNAKNPGAVGRALRELAYLVETYDLPGYQLPDEVAEILPEGMGSRVV